MILEFCPQLLPADSPLQPENEAEHEMKKLEKQLTLKQNKSRKNTILKNHTDPDSVPNRSQSVDPENKKKSKLTGYELYRKNLERNRIMLKTKFKMDQIADMAMKAK